MKVILLAGGFGTRISEYTDTIPKPMIEIGGKPMLWHIMNLYARYNHKDFFVALGYKGEIRYDSSKPDGMQKKLLDISRLKDLGWEHSTSLEKGIDTTYKWFIENISRLS